MIKRPYVKFMSPAMISTKNVSINGCEQFKSLLQYYQKEKENSLLRSDLFFHITFIMYILFTNIS